MKRFLTVLVITALLSPLFVNSAVVGDINQDGKIDLMESIYALQVASGVYPTIEDSCLLTGQGAWGNGVDYNLCDVVTFSEQTYACTDAHTSLTGSIEPSNTDYWTALSIKGDQGDPGLPAAGTEITSLPATISLPGFYYITKDLKCETGSGIIITADDVTLDLMGFSLDGSGTPNYSRGISMNGRANVEIRNGTIKNFTSSCVFEQSPSGKGHRIINIRGNGNGSGISLSGSGHLVEKCTMINNGGTGIFAENSSIVTGNICYNNDGNGITVSGSNDGSGSTVTGNVCYNNTLIGISASPGMGFVVTGNTCYENGRYGIFVNKGSVVIGNSCYKNGLSDDDYGIYSFGGLIDQNSSHENGTSGTRNFYCFSCTLGTNSF